jgi:hypothetical protein
MDAFTDCVEQLLERCMECVAVKGDAFEEK